MNENNHAALSFDRMRSTLMRAAEIRESEQQQIFDALDEIHARMSPLESLGAVRKRLAELPDRTEVGVLAERLDEALGKLETQDSAIAGLSRAVDGLVDKLAKPFAQLDGRLDGVAGRFEGVAGRMDGLEDKLSHIHKRLDDLDGRFDKTDVRLDGLPSSITGPVRDRLEAVEASLSGRLGEVDEGLHEHLDGTRESVQRSLAEGGDAIRKSIVDSGDKVQRSVAEGTDSVRKSVSDGSDSLRQTFTEGSDSLRQSFTEGSDSLRQSVAEGAETLKSELAETRTGVHGKLDELSERPKAIDHSPQLGSLAERLEQLTGRLDEVTTRLDSVESGVRSRIGELDGTVQESLDRIDGSLANRPDADSLVSLVRKENDDLERRHAGHLDEAMATFAELIIGGAQPSPMPPTTLPRSPRRRPAKSVVKGRDSKSSLDDADEIAEGA